MDTRTADKKVTSKRPLADLPGPGAVYDAGFSLPSSPPPPDDNACFALWDKYTMLPNVRQHSLMVAHIATTLSRRVQARGIAVDMPLIRAAALLHDIAKSYCVRHGGSHAQQGASWTITETHNFAVAQAVLVHVYWPWQLPQDTSLCTTPFFIIYADKRVKHNECVTLDKRFEDLLARYGHSEDSREGIRASHEQGKAIERALSALIGDDTLHEDSFDCGRLVQ